MCLQAERPSRLVLSIDIEDWPQSTWDRSLELTQRAAENAERVLDILAEHSKKATMFVLGRFAERFPAVVKRMAQENHEVASHGYSHIEIFRQTAEEFREDVYRSKCILEDLSGSPVLGYRAPDFSIISRTIWALDILAELGFQYDSSIFPIHHGRYGIPSWPTHPVKANLRAGLSIVELPIATATILGRRWPVAGGGYHRLLPSPIIHWAITNTLRRGVPFVVYCHPYEFDISEFAELDLKIPLRVRLHQGIGRRGFRAKFERLLKSFQVVPAYRIALDHRWPEYLM